MLLGRGEARIWGERKAWEFNAKGSCGCSTMPRVGCRTAAKSFLLSPSTTHA